MPEAPSAPPPEQTNPQLYETLQTKRSQERYTEHHKLDKPAESSLGDRSVQQALDLLEAYGIQAEMPAGKTLVGKLAQQSAELTRQADTLGTPEEQQALIGRSNERLYGYAVLAGKLGKALGDIETDLRRIEEEAKLHPDKISAQTIDEQRYLREGRSAIRSLLEQHVPFLNPEAFLAHELVKLRGYKREYSATGLVTTESIAVLDHAITLKLLEKGVVALVGETGTGKTQRAKRIATELSERFHPGDKSAPYYFVMGHRFTSREDLLSYLGLNAATTTPEQAMRVADQAWERYEKTLDESTSAKDRLQRKQDIRNIVLGQSESPQLRTEEFLGAVLQGAREGKAVIIDEFNYINPALLASLNELMQTKPGSTFTTPGGQTITVSQGFGMIFTGNLSLASAKRYLERHQLDPALINRLNSGLFEYNTPPMDDIDNPLSAAGITDEQRKEGHTPTNRELFQIALTALVDPKGNLYAPDTALAQTWQMIQAFKVFQNNFAGRPLRPDDLFQGDKELRLQVSHASMRTMMDVLKSWKSDLYAHPLEYYLYEHLIRPAQIIAPQEAAYFYDILKRKYSMFQDSYWDDKLSIDGTTRNLHTAGAIHKSSLKSNDQFKVFTVQEVAESFSGYQMPKEIKDIKSAAPAQKTEEQVVEEIATMEQQVAEIKKFIAAMQGTPQTERDRLIAEGKKDQIREGTLDLFCADEAAIMGQAA